MLIVQLASCTYDFPEVAGPTSGTADFTRIISVGNSITAGFANGALYDDGQANSFGSIVAGQLLIITPGIYNQPDINSPLGYLGIASGIPGIPDGSLMGRLRLVNPDDPLDDPLPQPIIPGDPFNDIYTGDKSAMNNFGVPGMRLIDADVIGYANDNKYYKRFALDENNSSLISDAVAADGSFFTFWLGNNDVLGFATAGASGNPSGDGSNDDDLISLSIFESKYEPIISQLLSNGAQGVIANIANVTDIPFFTTVPYDLLYFDASDPADTLKMYDLNQLYTTYNEDLAVAVLNGEIDSTEANQRVIKFALGNNGVVIYDKNLTDLSGDGTESIRMSDTNDLLTFLAITVFDQDLGAGLIGSEVPFDDEYVLTPEEQSIILERTAGFNEIIQATINDHREKLALVDINTIFKELAASGANINGSPITASIFPPFGGFSLDGTHPNPRGAAFIANHFIEAINIKFMAIIPLVNPNNYPGNELPVP